jgi:DNA-binding NarL/FixJ family response regulator
LAVLNELTKREVAILRLLAQGEEDRKIAIKLNAAEQTIKSAVSVINTKLGVDNRKEARRFALKSGLAIPTGILKQP